MKTGYQGEAQVVFIQEDEPQSYRETTGIEYDFFGCLEVMEIRLMKRIDQIEVALNEQNKKLNLILEHLLPKKGETGKIFKRIKQNHPKFQPDPKYIEIPYDFQQSSFTETNLVENYTEPIPSQVSETHTSSEFHNFDSFPQIQPVQYIQPEKKRKLEEVTTPVEVEVVECVEVISPGQATPFIQNEPNDYEVEIEIEQIEELPKSVIPPVSHPNPNRGAKHPTIKVQAIPTLPIDNIEILRGFNRSLTVNKEMASEFIQILRENCGDDIQNATARLITSIIGQKLLLQSTWASKSTGRVRISNLNGIINCMQKAALHSPFDGLEIGLIREKVMELLHTIKGNRPQTVNPSSIKKENIV